MFYLNLRLIRTLRSTLARLCIAAFDDDPMPLAWVSVAAALFWCWVDAVVIKAVIKNLW